MQLKRKKLILKKEGIKEQVCQLTESDDIEEELMILQRKFYKSQLAIFEMQMKIISEKEKLYRMQLKDFKTEENNNGIDAPETDIVTVNDPKSELDQEEDEFFDSVQHQHNDGEQGSSQQNEDQIYNDMTECTNDGNTTGCVNDDKITEEDSNIINQFFSTVSFSETEKEVVINNEVNISEEKKEEWRRKQVFINALNRLYRKRAWLRNKKVSKNCLFVCST